jgi:hypothetical protein
MDGGGLTVCIKGVDRVSKMSHHFFTSALKVALWAPCCKVAAKRLTERNDFAGFITLAGVTFESQG